MKKRIKLHTVIYLYEDKTMYFNIYFSENILSYFIEMRVKIGSSWYFLHNKFKLLVFYYKIGFGVSNNMVHSIFFISFLIDFKLWEMYWEKESFRSTVSSCFVILLFFHHHIISKMNALLKFNNLLDFGKGQRRISWKFGIKRWQLNWINWIFPYSHNSKIYKFGVKRSTYLYTHIKKADIFCMKRPK